MPQPRQQSTKHTLQLIKLTIKNRDYEHNDQSHLDFPPWQQCNTKFLLQGKLQGTLSWANNTISEISLHQLVCFQSRSPPWHFGRGSICILFGSSSVISGQKKRTYRNTNSFSSGMAMMFGQARLSSSLSSRAGRGRNSRRRLVNNEDGATVNHQ
jgi:hypothetical protein